MPSDELFSDQPGAPEASGVSERPRSRDKSRNKLSLRRYARVLLGPILLMGTLAGTAIEATIAAAPAAAAQANGCIDPATGGSSQTFVEGVPSSTYTVECEEETGISGTSAYPTITIATGSLPADGSPSLASGASCTTATSGSGTTEEYIEECKLTDSPTSSDGGTYPLTFTSTPGTFAGSTLSPATSGTLTVTISPPAVTCIDPASGGTAATWHEGVTSSYTVECEQQSDVSGVTAYPSSIVVATDTIPADANATLGTCTTGTSGSGATEEYIKECPFSATPSASDAGTYAATFTATGDGAVGSATSGNLNVTVNAATVSCIDPASGGSSATFVSSAGGTVNAYTVECEEQSGISAVTAYPTSIAIDPSSNLPADATLSATYNGTGTLPSTCTHATSGSGATEEYILECDLNETAVSSDNGSYTGVFDAVGAGGAGSATSGTLTLTVAGPSDVCTAPASGGTATTFKVGIANTYSVSCYGTGFSSASPGNYPASITLNTGTLPADATEATSTSSSPACTTSTSGSGLTEEYILSCPVAESPTASDTGAYPVTFTATPGANGGNAVTTGTWTLTVAGINPTCIDPASGGTATTFYEGTASSYTVECEAQSGVSGTSAYPSSIQSATGSLPSDGNPTFATSTSSSPACTTGTSGSGATEEYILECALADTPTSSDGGSYPLTFTATGPGGAGSATSGTLTVTISPPTTTCSTPASGGTSVSWTDGTAESETITCYSQGFGSANAGNYPASITLNTGTLPSDASEATSLASSPPCTTATSGSGVSEEYELECNVTDTPVYSDNGTYPVTFLATGGANGAPSVTSGTLTITIAQPPPSWETDAAKLGNYFSAIKGVPFCYDIAVTTSTSGGATTGSPGSLPLTSLTAGTTPANVSNYSIQDVNLAAGTGQICGTNNNAVASAPVTMAPVATNTGGSATDSIPLWSQNECTWSSTGTGLSTAVSMFDANQDLEQAGSQSAFGQPITNGVAGGTVKGAAGESVNEPTCPGGVGVSASGGLGDAWTMNTANPLPTPTDTNPSASQGDLASSNLDLTSATSASVGGCYGATNILASTSTSAFGTSTASMTLPSNWVNGGDCAYGSLGSNSAGGNTDTPELNGPTGDAACPPSQADVNAGFVDCTIILSSGNDENGSTNYSSLDLFYNNQPVPQTPTATLSVSSALPGGAVTVSGGTNWWGANDGAPNSGPYGDDQNDSSDFYPVAAPSVYIGTSRVTAVPVVGSTVTIPANTYACTGAESNTAAPNPCTLTVGQPTGTFSLPAGLQAGSYNVYIDESNTTPLPGNGPNDAYQTALGTTLGTVESSTPIQVPQAASTTASQPTSLSLISGQSDTDVATVSGDATYGTPTGSVDFYTCPENVSPCTTTTPGVTADPANPVSLSGGSATSSQFTPNSSGTWCFAAVYSGDTNYTASSDQSSDECFSVSTAISTTVSNPTNASISLGATNTDVATVSGNATYGTPTGSVDFYWCGENVSPCTPTTPGVTADPANPVTLVGGSATSSPNTPDSGGTWCFAAVYSGDTNYTASSDQGSDECYTVNPDASTSVSTPSSSTAALLGPNSDTVLITGADGAANAPYPTGSVTFYTCAENVVPCTSSSWQQLGSPVTLGVGSGNTNVATSSTFDNTGPAGTWCFAAVYSGDSSYTTSSDQSSDECYTVSHDTTTTMSAPAKTTIVGGQSDTDEATVTGNTPVGPPTGTVTFYECGPTATPTSSCASGTQVGNPVTVATSGHSGTAASAPFTPPSNSSGYWCFRAVYNGDSNYLSSTDDSADECFYESGPLAITTTSPLPSGIKKASYSVQLQAAGGVGPYKWSYTGTLPTGLSLSSSGLLSGTPKAKGTYTFTVKVKDSSTPNEKASESVSITVLK